MWLFMNITKRNDAHYSLQTPQCEEEGKKRKCAKYHTLEGKWERNAIPNKLPIYIIHNNA